MGYEFWSCGGDGVLAICYLLLRSIRKRPNQSTNGGLEFFNIDRLDKMSLKAGIIRARGNLVFAKSGHCNRVQIRLI